MASFVSNKTVNWLFNRNFVLITGINDTCNKLFTVVNYLSPVSLLPAINYASGVVTSDKLLQVLLTLVIALSQIYICVATNVKTLDFRLLDPILTTCFWILCSLQTCTLQGSGSRVLLHCHFKTSSNKRQVMYSCPLCKFTDSLYLPWQWHLCNLADNCRDNDIISTLLTVALTMSCLQRCLQIIAYLTVTSCKCWHVKVALTMTSLQCCIQVIAALIMISLSCG